MKIFKLGGVGAIVHYKEGKETIKVRLTLSELAQLEANPNEYFKKPAPKAEVKKEEPKATPKAPAAKK